MWLLVWLVGWRYGGLIDSLFALFVLLVRWLFRLLVRCVLVWLLESLVWLFGLVGWLVGLCGCMLAWLFV